MQRNDRRRKREGAFAHYAIATFQIALVRQQTKNASVSEVRVAGYNSPCCNHVTEPLLLLYLQLGAPRWLDPAAVIRRARTRKRADAPTVRDDDCVTLE